MNDSDQSSFSQGLIEGLFVAQDRRPEPLADINLQQLDPFQRGLLVMVGLVTQFIEAYRLEPVRVLGLSQQPEILEVAEPWLEQDRGGEVISRRVLLTGHDSGRYYVHGSALIVADRLPEELRPEVANPGLGLGRALRQGRVEMHGDLLWCGLETAAAAPELESAADTVISRTTRFVTAGRPFMLITERFPLAAPD